jgi:phosphate/sulfate permease
MTHQDTQFIIPMGQVIISYTFWYFVYCLSVNQFEIANIGLIVFFILLISSDIAWNYYNNCFGLFNSFIAFIIGGAMGATYAAIVDTTSSRKVLYSFSGSNNTESCKVPSKQKFKCSVSEGGRFFQ